MADTASSAIAPESHRKPENHLAQLEAFRGLESQVCNLMRFASINSSMAEDNLKFMEDGPRLLGEGTASYCLLNEDQVNN